MKTLTKQEFARLLLRIDDAAAAPRRKRNNALLLVHAEVLQYARTSMRKLLTDRLDRAYETLGPF